MKKFSTKLHSFLKPLSPRTRWKEILALLVLLLAIVFFRSERKELHSIIPELKRAGNLALFLLTGSTAATILFQGGMYRFSFAATGRALPWQQAIPLFLKRNFLSVFLPAGAVSALAYSPSRIRKDGFTATQTHQSSGIFAFAGLLSVFLAGVPVIIYSIFIKSPLHNAWMGMLILVFMIGGLYWIVRSLREKGKLYGWLQKKLPRTIPTIDELFAANVQTKKVVIVILFSLGIELCGMLTIWVAMMALNQPVSFGVAAATYIIGILMAVMSPFLRGLGAVELSMVYVLGQFGYAAIPALSITILYRVFEFWLPLLAGLIAFAWKGRTLFLRAYPALLTFALGIVNIISVITPPIRQRVRILHNYLPMDSIQASNMLVLFAGLALLVTAAFLIRGSRSAWMVAIALTAFSLIGHITKALDYEEASLAALALVSLLLTARQYKVRNSNKWMQTGLLTSAIAFAAVLIFGFVSFYFIDKRHFNTEFTWQQSLVHTFKIFLLIDDQTLHPVSKFGHDFTLMIRCLGFITWGYFLFSFIKPARHKNETNDDHRKRAQFLLEQYGGSPLDYFKVYKDKLIFLSDRHDAFVSYRVASGFAIVLEEPVCAREDMTDVLIEFDLHCRKMGLKTAFYRVDENGIPWFNELRKQKLMIGQEAIIDTQVFTMEGREKKSLRNGMNALQKKGYIVNLYKAPHDENFLKTLREVSDEWLTNGEVEESVFSQGMFDEQELKNHDIISVEDDEGKLKAFLNVIPDFAGDDCTYDLIRKTNDAPGAAMDALIIRLVDYARDKNKRYVNLGLAPMSGIADPDNTAERIIRIASERIRRFRHFKGLREFKEKYATMWENKYLVYDNDFDLLQLPAALNKVTRP